MREEIKPKEFDVFVTQTLSKDSTIITRDYITRVNTEYNQQGKAFHETYDDTSNVNWIKEYKKNQHTPLEIINACRDICNFFLKSNIDHVGDINIKPLLKSCEGWVEDDFEVLKD